MKYVHRSCACAKIPMFQCEHTFEEHFLSEAQNTFQSDDMQPKLATA